MASKSRSKSKTRTPKKTVELQDAKIGFIGAGKMTESIINGLINFCKISAKKIFVAAPTEKNTGRFKELGCTTTKRNIDIFARYEKDLSDSDQPTFVCSTNILKLRSQTRL